MVATANVPADDIVINLYRPDNSLAQSADTGASPEALDYQLIPSDPSGAWYARVCEFSDVPNFAYTGFYQVSSAGSPQVFPFPPQWNFFTANPALPAGPMSPPFNYPNTDNRTKACWTTTDPGSPPDCQFDLTPNVGDTNLASRVPWDHNVQTNLPNFQTDGNNAFTAEAWNAALTPGSTAQRPVDLDRTYGFLELADPQSPTGALEGWTNSWNQNRCNYVVAQTPAQNNIDVMASVTNLFAGHNRMHDFSYYLGLHGAQLQPAADNFGRPHRDPPVGARPTPRSATCRPARRARRRAGLPRPRQREPDHAAGRRSPASRTSTCSSRSPAAFYAPCVDGDLDTSVFGHEYTHADLQPHGGRPRRGPHRLPGRRDGRELVGPGRAGVPARVRLRAHRQRREPVGRGAYVTGNKQRGIRDYAHRTPTR